MLKNNFSLLAQVHLRILSDKHFDFKNVFINFEINNNYD